MTGELKAALWAGDVDQLQQLAPCGCCCDEHTFEGCPARLWQGCRGQGSLTRADHESWARHYAEHHGMCAERFAMGQCLCCPGTRINAAG